MLKQLKGLFTKREQSQLQRARDFGLSAKPFSEALCFRAAALQNEAIRDLLNSGMTRPVKRHDSLLEFAESAAITIAFDVTTEASKAAGKPHVFMPLDPLPTDMTVAFSLVILAGIQIPLRAEDVELRFSDAAARLALQFYIGHSDSERIAHAQRGTAAFQTIVRADQENVREWRENCLQLVEYYVLQWTTADEQLRQRDFVPLFASLLTSVLRSVE